MPFVTSFVSNEASVGKTKILGNYSYLSGSTELKENGVWTKKDFLVRRPVHQLSLQASIPITKKWTSNVTYQYVGQRVDLVYDEAIYSTVQKELSGYHWMDVSFNYQWNDKFRMHLMVKNALNQKIVELYGYNGVPVLFSGGVGLVIE